MTQSATTGAATRTNRMAAGNHPTPKVLPFWPDISQNAPIAINACPMNGNRPAADKALQSSLAGVAIAWGQERNSGRHCIAS